MKRLTDLGRAQVKRRRGRALLTPRERQT